VPAQVAPWIHRTLAWLRRTASGATAAPYAAVLSYGTEIPEKPQEGCRPEIVSSLW